MGYVAAFGGARAAMPCSSPLDADARTAAVEATLRGGRRDLAAKSGAGWSTCFDGHGARAQRVGSGTMLPPRRDLFDGFGNPFLGGDGLVASVLESPDGAGDRDR